MNENLKDQDALLVKEKGSDELKVASMDKSGKVKTASPNAENPDFLRIDKNGNVLENFFENFKRQFNNPTEFAFFKVPADKIKEATAAIQNALKNPETPENKQFLDMHKVKPEDFEKKQGQTTAIDENRLDWAQFERLGVTRETLQKTGNLDKLLNWQKTDLLPISPKFDDTTLRTDARLSLRETPDGKLSVAIHALRKEPELQRPYFGVQFTDEDKQNLKNTGNLGRVVEAEFKQGVKTPVVISIDKQTNELVAVRADKIKIPENIKGVALNEEQKNDLAQGKSVYLENMMSRKNEPFSAHLQFNADKRSLEFRFDNDTKQGQTQNQNQTQGNKQDDVPKTFRKKDLSEDQQSSLKEGKTVYVDGLTDKNGKVYSGYITLNKENRNFDFMFSKDYKEAVAAGKVVPDDRHKTQVAKNNDGTTTEATKNIKEPMEKGQTQPTEKQAEKQQKKTGIKM